MKPSYIYLNATTRCNLKCLYCKTWKQTPDEISLDQIKDILIKLKQWLGPFTVEIAGGEPLLRKDIVKIIQFCTNNHIMSKITTNGILLTKKTAKDLKKAKLANLNISLDGIGEINDKTRGRGTFKIVKENLKNTKNIPITISTVVTSHNEAHLKELLGFCKTNNYDLILQGFITNPGYEKENKMLWPKNPENLNISTLNTKKQLNQIKNYYKNKKGIKCEISYNNFIITEKGKVQICFYMEPIGDLLKQKPEQIWNSQKAQSIRKRINQCNKGCSLLNCNFPK